MELHQLRSTLAVAETGNFTRASERCRISQPALSQQILNLEKEVGHKLFHRLGRRAVPTEAGAAFLERARRILFEVDNAARELRDHPGLERQITVGAVQTVMPFLLTPFIAALRTSHPNLIVHAQEDFRGNLVRALVEGELDLAVLPLPVKEPRLSIEPLLTDPLLLTVAHDHPFARRREISIGDLADETFITLGDSSTLAAQITAFFGDHNFMPRVGFRCAQVATLKQFVARRLGISILPQLARVPEDQDTLTYLRLAGVEPTRQLAIVRHLQRYQSRGSQQFISLLREQLRHPDPPPEEGSAQLPFAAQS